MADLERIKSQAKQEFLEDCRNAGHPEDLWKLIWIIRYIINDGDYPTEDQDRADPAVVQRLALEIVDELLEAGELQASFTNYPITDTYKLEPSSLPRDQIRRRIEAEWRDLGREPSMCEIVTFTTPAGGRGRAEGVPRSSW